MNVPKQIYHSRLAIFSGTLLLGLALLRIADVPLQVLSTDILSSLAGIPLSATSLMLLLLAGLTATSVEAFIRSHPTALAGELGLSIIYWIVPTLLVIGLASWLTAAGTVGIWIAGMFLSFLLIPLSLATEYRYIGVDGRPNPLVKWSELILIYLVSTALYTFILSQEDRTILSSLAVMAVTILLAGRVLTDSAPNPSGAFLYGTVLGIVLGLMTWLISQWPLTTIQGGFLLFLTFYVYVNLVQHHINNSINRRVVAEYIGISILALLLLILL